MVLATEKLLMALNSEELKSHLKEYPFSAENIKLRMLFRKKNPIVGDGYYPTEIIESAVLDENIISYNYSKPHAGHSIFAQESFQEAQNIVENTPSLTLFQKIAKNMRFLILDSIYVLEVFYQVSLLLLLFVVFSGAGILIGAIILLVVIFRRWRLSKH